MRFRQSLSHLLRGIALAVAVSGVACGGGGSSSATPVASPDAAVVSAVAANSTPLATIDSSAATSDADLAAFGAAVGRSEERR